MNRAARAVFVAAVLAGTGSVASGEPAPPPVQVGFLPEIEGRIAAEIAARMIQRSGEARAVARPVADVQTAFAELESGGLSFAVVFSHPLNEYLEEEAGAPLAALRPALEERTLIAQSLGFSRTFVVAAATATPALKSVSALSELPKRVRLPVAFSPEFRRSETGFRALVDTYDLRLPKGERPAGVRAIPLIQNGTAALADTVQTDPGLQSSAVRVLTDDKGAFPPNAAVLVARSAEAERLEQSWEALQRLESQLTVPVLRRLVELVRDEGKSIAETVDIFIGSSQWISLAERRKNSVERPRPGLVEDYFRQTSGYWRRLARLTAEHSFLVFASLAAALLAGLPLGMRAAEGGASGEILQAAGAVFQTVPALAFLCFLIPFFGFGVTPALVALFLFSVLTIARSVVAGLQGQDPVWADSAQVMGLTSAETMWRVKLPLAMPSVVAGVRSAAVASVGIATVAALLGAGGFGSLIVAGLALNDVATVLRGALPAALFAMAVNWIFEFGGWLILPRGLR